MDNKPFTHYGYLMEVIDQYKAEKSGKNTGPLSFLREDLGVRYFMTTPRFPGSVESLKTYLAKDILDCFPAKASYLSYKNVNDNLAGIAEKTYVFNTNLLEKCFDRSENIASVKDTAMFLSEEWEEDLMRVFQQDEHLSWILLRMIQKNVEEHMHAYWGCCTSEEKSDADKKDECRKIAYGAALHEIFLKEMLEKKAYAISDELEKQGELMSDIVLVLDQCLKKRKETDTQGDIPDILYAASESIKTGPRSAGRSEDSQRNLVEKLREANENLEKLSTQFGDFWVYILLALEQQICFHDELTMLMIFDYIRYQDGKDCTLSKAICEAENANLPFDAGLNRNRGKAYRMMKAYVEEIILSYWDLNTLESKLDFYDAVMDYLHRICGKDGHGMSKKDILQIRCRMVSEWLQTK